MSLSSRSDSMLALYVGFFLFLLFSWEIQTHTCHSVRTKRKNVMRLRVLEDPILDELLLFFFVYLLGEAKGLEKKRKRGGQETSYASVRLCVRNQAE